MTAKCTNDGCGVSLGRYLYTDGRTVELCPFCDREHADELRPLLEFADEPLIEHVAEWLHLAIWRAHGREQGSDFRSAVLYSAQATSRAQQYAQEICLMNPATGALRTRLVHAVGDYTYEVLRARLGELLDASRRAGYADGLADAPRVRRRRQVNT